MSYFIFHEDKSWVNYGEDFENFTAQNTKNYAHVKRDLMEQVQTIHTGWSSLSGARYQYRMCKTIYNLVINKINLEFLKFRHH